MEDLRTRSTKYKEHGDKIAEGELILLANLLLSDALAPQLIPLLEKEAIAEVLQHYIKSKYGFMLFCLLSP